MTATYKKYHICQSVSGALKNWSKKEWENMANHNGMTVDAVKERFRIYEFEGKNVIPLHQECEGFSYKDGCPGHESAGDE
jgi:hypothetical protein